MRATNPRTALAVTLLLPVLAAPARGQESPLAQVPADAALVVRLSGIEKAQGRLGKMIGNALPDMAPQINTQIEEALRSGPLQMLKDRDLSAVAKDRPVFLVFPTFEGLGEDPPGVVLLLPVSDPAAFRKGFFKAEPKKAEEGVEAYELEDLGQTVYVTDRKGYVAAAPGRAALKALKGEGLAGRLTPDVAETLSAADVAAYVNLRALNEAYGEQIQGFKQLMELGLQQGAPGVDEASAKMAKMFFDGLFQVLEDGQGFAVAFEFRPEGLNLRLLASFGSDTKTNNFLKGIKPDALAGLGGLPGGAMIYSAMRIDPSVFDALGGMMFNVLGNQEDEKVAEQMKRQLKA
ncbi:MAG TPA: hypothetical protein VIL46_08860, partial [Gemmataceae bacterium]